MHAAQMEESSFDYAAFASRRGPSAWGVSLQRFSPGKVDQTDSSGNTTGSLSPSDVALSGAYARDFHGYGLGLSAKYIRSKLVDTAQVMALDAGTITPGFWNNKLRFGAALTNVGGKVKYDQESDPLPTTIRLGAEARLWKGWAATADVVAPKAGDSYVALGGEYQFSVLEKFTLAARAGYNGRTSIGGKAEGLSAGLGFGWESFSVDYAFVSHGDLDPSQVISLGYAF